MKSACLIVIICILVLKITLILIILVYFNQPYARNLILIAIAIDTSLYCLEQEQRVLVAS